MPSPSPLHLSTTSSSQENAAAATAANGVDEVSEHEAPNGRIPNGIQDPKEKAKAAMPASGPPAGQDGVRDRSPASNQQSNGLHDLANGTVTTRKRSRSGSPIIRSSMKDRTLKPRGSNDPKSEGLEKVELEQYVQRNSVHLAAKIHSKEAMHQLHDFKREERGVYMRLRDANLELDNAERQLIYGKQKADRERWLDPPVKPLRNPEAIFGPGYGQYGNFGNGTTQQPKASIQYPADRKRAGGRVTKELHVKRKDLATQAEQLDELIPIRLDVEWNKIRLRDTFTWNLHDRVVHPDLFAQQLVEDFGLPLNQCGPLVQQVSASLKEQIQDFYPHVFIEEEALDIHLPYTAYKDDEMRINIKLNITIGQHTLVDQFEWEINNPSNSPEAFARQMTQDLSLAGEFTTAIAHSIREQSQLFTRSLYVTGHPFDGRPIEDQELKAGFLPSPMPSPFRPYQAAKEFTPYLYELNDAELEKTELSLSREERRQKRSVNRRGGPALPDLKDRRRTIRTLVVSSVLPGAAENVEDSRLFKRPTASSGKTRRSGYGHKDGIDDSDESDSEESVSEPAIPAHLLSGTARTRGMRGAATAAQAAMRGNLARSATPETSNLHHHETRTSGRRSGGRDYREESVDDSPPSLKVKLRIPRERYRQFMRDQKARLKAASSANLAPPAPVDHRSHRRSLSGTPGRNTPAPGAMGPPNTPGIGNNSQQQHQQQNQQQSTPKQHLNSGEHKDGTNPLHPHAAQIGRVDAAGPPSQEHPMPDPPSWLGQALGKLQQTYPDDLFEGTMRYTAVSTVSDLPITLRPNEPPPPDTKYMYYPRIKCLDCPGKLYTPGPETGVTNFESTATNSDMLSEFSSILLLTFLSSSTHTLPLPGSLIQCTSLPQTPLTIPPPTSRNCAIALRALPSVQAIGPFHVGGPADDFQLPLTMSYGTCTVAVELAMGRDNETSSWMQIGLAATQLSMACVDAGGQEGMGGRTTAGAGNGIVVTVRESGGGSVPWRNASFVDA
ncbi:SWI/SNF chromatin-remodeling complex subunit [Lecanora helva]